MLSTSSNKNIDVSSSLSLLKKYLLVDDFGIKVRSLQVGCFTILVLFFSSSLCIPFDACSDSNEHLHFSSFFWILQALGFVLIARPEFMLEKDIGKIIEATLTSGSHVRLKVIIIPCVQC